MTRIYTFIAATLFVLLPGASSQGAVVTTTLDLSSATSEQNQLTLSILGNPATFDLSGSLGLAVEFDNANSVTAFRITSGSFTGTDWIVDVGAPLEATISGTNTTGVFESEAGFSAVTGTSFDATQHLVRITGGDVLIDEDEFDFSAAAIVGRGVGTGTLELTPGVGPNNFNVRFELPVEGTTDIEGIPLTISGTIVATGSITAVPEPSSFAALTVIGLAGVAVRRRRQRRALAPAATDA